MLVYQNENLRVALFWDNIWNYNLVFQLCDFTAFLIS